MPDFNDIFGMWNGAASGNRRGYRTDGTGTIKKNDKAIRVVRDPMSGFNFGPGLDQLPVGSGLAEGALKHGFAMDTEANARRDAALATLQAQLGPGTLQDQIENSASEFLSNPGKFDEELIRLIFAQGSDQAGAGAIGATRALNSVLGARGISNSSPLAAGMAADIERSRTAAVRGVQRDVTIEKLRSDVQNRALAFQNALAAQQSRNDIVGNIAALQNQQVPGYGYDSMQGLTEMLIDSINNKEALKAGKKASSNSLIGDVIGGVIGIASKL